MGRRRRSQHVCARIETLETKLPIRKPALAPVGARSLTLIVHRPGMRSAVMLRQRRILLQI